MMICRASSLRILTLCLVVLSLNLDVSVCFNLFKSSVIQSNRKVKSLTPQLTLTQLGASLTRPTSQDLLPIPKVMLHLWVKFFYVFTFFYVYLATTFIIIANSFKWRAVWLIQWQTITKATHIRSTRSWCSCSRRGSIRWRCFQHSRAVSQNTKKWYQQSSQPEFIILMKQQAPQSFAFQNFILG